MNLSEHFTLEELITSQYATRNNIDNTPTPSVLGNLYVLADTLEAIRKVVGKPLIISSGYRCPAVNKAVGGADNSYHMLGLAADINVSGMSPKLLANLIINSNVPFQQLIYEGTWIHVGILNKQPMAREVLTATFKDGKATYTKGI